jgi:hypothetical protein
MLMGLKLESGVGWVFNLANEESVGKVLVAYTRSNILEPNVNLN